MTLEPSTILVVLEVALKVVLALASPVILVYFFANPEKFDKWCALAWKVLQGCRALYHKANKHYIRLDLQGRVNEFVKDLARQAPFLARTRVRVEWVGDEVTRSTFLDDGQVILRLKRNDPENHNFVHGVYLFVSACLLHKAKRYISPSQRLAVDLYVTTQLLQKEKHAVVDVFLDEYLHPLMEKSEGKVNDYFDQLAKIDEAGFFYPVLLQELTFLGEKVYGGRRSDQIITEVDGLIRFLAPIASRTVGQEQDLEFVQDFCRCAIIIVGKPQKLTPTGKLWTNYIRNTLIPQQIETIYLIGRAENAEVLERISVDVAPTYEVITRRRRRVPIHYPDGRKVQIDQHLVLLRKRGISVFQPSQPALSA